MSMEPSFSKSRLFYPLILLFLLLSNSYAWANHLLPVEGTLEIRIADYMQHPKQPPKHEVIDYALLVDNGAVYSLRFTDKTPNYLKSGQRLRVKQGKFLSVAADGRQEIMLSSHDIKLVKDIPLTAKPASFGDQKTIVMLVNFQDKPNDRPWTANEVHDVVFKTLNDMFYEYSYHQTTVSGNVIGWYTLPMNSNASCGEVRNSLPTYANDAARKAGIDISSYTRRIYMFPNNPNCGWAGLGTLGNVPSKTWLNGLNRSDVTGHEVGHNFGLYHSNRKECDAGTNEGNCQVIEYGDYADIMGFPYFYPNAHFNSVQKESLGWLNYQNSPPIQTIDKSGTYAIDVFETVSGRAKALKIMKTRHSDRFQTYYYLELRQGIGFDKNLGDCTNCDFTTGVLVHEGVPGFSAVSNLLDMTPNDGDKERNVTLHAGQSFTDKTAENGGVTLTVDSVSATGAVVTVKFGDTPPPVCEATEPTMVVFPSRVRMVKKGETGFFTIQLTNNDSEKCAPSTYKLNVVADSLLNAAIEAQTLTVKPGETRDFFLTASTRQNTPTGLHDIAVNAENIEHTDATASTIAKLSVQ